MAFDWLRFLDQYHIEYITSGANVSRGNVNIHCPFCGVDDPSYHLGVSTENKGWGCWRRHEHRGKSPVRLVAALLHCSNQQATEIIGYGRVIPSDFMAQVKANLEPPVADVAQFPLVQPVMFKAFVDLPSARPFIAYLRNRGFTMKTILSLTEDHRVFYCTKGPYKGRIIFLVTFEDQLVSWTGRTIYPSETLRYKSLTTKADRAEKEGLGQAMVPINDCVLWYDELMKGGANTIFLTEGPFDALKVSVLGKRYGVTATCLFTSYPTREQVSKFHLLLPRFEHRYVLLDQGTLATSLKLTGALSSLGVKVKVLPKHIKDPGELTQHDLQNLIT